MNMSITFSAIGMDILIGVLSTIVGLVIFHVVTPTRIRFSQDIMRTPVVGITDQFKYVVRVRRVGGVFGLIDVSVNCSFRVKWSGDAVTNYRIPTSYEYSPRLGKSPRRIALRAHEFDLSNKPRMRDALAASPDKDLLDWLHVHPSASVQVVVLGTDAFTGVRRMFVSPPYKAHCVREGVWKGDLVAPASPKDAALPV